MTSAGPATDSEATHAESTRAVLALVDAGERIASQTQAGGGSFLVGGRTCRVVSNDEALAARLTRCLIATDVAQSWDFTLSLVSGSAPPGIPPPSWNLPHTSRRHLERLHIDDAAGLRAFYDHDRRFWSVADVASRRGIMWLADAADVPPWEEAAPFKMILHWLIGASTGTFLHGGVVAHEGRGLLLAGPGGSGKSTTVMAAVAAGLRTCGDDLVVVDDAAGWTAHAAYDAVKFAPSAGGRVPDAFARAPARPCGDKLLVRYSDVSPGSLMQHTPLVALAHCVLAGTPTSSITPLDPAAMLRALGPPTAFLLRGTERDTLRKAAAAVRSLPTFMLALGREPAEAAAVVARWLEGRVA